GDGRLPLLLRKPHPQDGLVRRQGGVDDPPHPEPHPVPDHPLGGSRQGAGDPIDVLSGGHLGPPFRTAPRRGPDGRSVISTASRATPAPAHVTQVGGVAVGATRSTASAPSS